MAEITLEYDCECSACDGTGLYVGMAELAGSAVVCSRCNGTGHRHIVIDYREFEGRNVRDNVRRVYRVNPGICIGEGNGLRLEDFGGMDYADWVKDTAFPAGSEDRTHTCPAWFYQSADYALKPDWSDGDVQCQLIGSFSLCKHFHEKHKCWARFDAEQASPERTNGED